MKKNIDVIIYVFSLFLIAFGGIIYIFFRPHNLLFWSFLRLIDIEKYFPYIVLNNSSRFLSFVIYSLPDGLWELSILCILGVNTPETEVENNI